MPTTADVIRERAGELLRELADAGTGPVRVTVVGRNLAYIVQVWPTTTAMPTARSAAAGGREQCRSDVVGVVRAAGRPLTRKSSGH